MLRLSFAWKFQRIPLIIYLMLNLKNVLVILGLLLSFVTKAADNSIINDDGKVNLSGSSHTARVISPRAIVYADENMLSPLGYIANGKAIIVGNPRRINPNLVPLVVYGRLAFIEMKDIRFEDTADEEYNAKRGAPREHDVDITIQKPEERLSENNSFYFSLHRYDGGDEVKQLFLQVDDADKSVFTGFNLQFIHRQSTSRFFWGAALDYSAISTPNMKFGYWLLSPTIGYTFMRNPVFLLEAYASLDLALNTELSVDLNFVNEPSGYVWGGQANARIVLFPESKYHAFGGIGLRKYMVSGFSPLDDLNGNETTPIRDITSINLFIGAAMEFK